MSNIKISKITVSILFILVLFYRMRRKEKKRRGPDAQAVRKSRHAVL